MERAAGRPMPMRRVFVVASMLAVIAACGGSRDEISRDLAVTTFSGVQGSWPAGHYEARTAAQWQTVWQLGTQGREVAPPRIDFNRYLVAGVSVLASSFCDEVLITGVAEQPNAIRVSYRLRRDPSPFCVGVLPQTRTVFALIEPLPKPVVFVEVQ
jgi:hypothetical protein